MQKRTNQLQCPVSGQFPIEELLNSVTHGLGLVLSIAALVLLVVFSSLYGSAWHIVGCSIYGATLVLLYGASTVYHSCKKPRKKQFLKIVDHGSIYLLIAGTYTPFMFVTLKGGWGWTIFGIIWGLALAGIIFKIFFVHRFKIVSTLIYLFMGWLIVIAISPLKENLPSTGIWWLFWGGMAYTVGTIFFAASKKVKFSHSIWHLFVLTGSICHFFSVLFYVVLQSS